MDQAGTYCIKEDIRPFLTASKGSNALCSSKGRREAWIGLSDCARPLVRCRDRWIRHVCVVVEQNLMFVHVVDVNLPRHRPNVPLKGNWHFLSPFLKSFIRLLGALRCPDGLVNR